MRDRASQRVSLAASYPIRGSGGYGKPIKLVFYGCGASFVHQNRKSGKTLEKNIQHSTFLEVMISDSGLEQ